jgi:hypothetical protein
MSARAAWTGVLLAGCWTAPPPPPPPLPTPQPARHAELSALAQPATPDEAAARATLGAVVAAWAIDPAEPWALSHALLATGPTLALADGARATDALVNRWGGWTEAGVRFPKIVGTTRVEPHTDLILKSLVGLGLPPSTPIEVGGRAGTLADVYAGSVARVWVDGGAASVAWDDLPWTVQALAAWTPPHAVWVADGHRTGIDALTHALAARLDKETAEIAAASASGGPLVKRGQGIFSYTCGGAHLLQAVAAAVAAGHGEPGDVEIVRRQVALHRWRFGAELAVTDQALAAAPEYRLLLTVQRLKFVGHWVETSHRLAAQGFLGADARAEVDRAEAELVASVRMLQDTGVLERMPALRAEREQTWLDVLGDSAHAAYGLDLGSGAARVVW